MFLQERKVGEEKGNKQENTSQSESKNLKIVGGACPNSQFHSCDALTEIPS